MIVKIIKKKNLTKIYYNNILNILKDNFPKLKNFDIYDETNFILFIKNNINNKNEEKIIGVICTIENNILKKYKNSKELFGYNFVNDNGIYLYNFVVIKNFRNKGYGKRMITYLINNHKKLEKTKYIYSLSTNDKSSNIFLNLGFCPGDHFLDKNNNFARIFTKNFN